MLDQIDAFNQTFRYISSTGLDAFKVEILCLIEYNTLKKTDGIVRFLNLLDLKINVFILIFQLVWNI